MKQNFITFALLGLATMFTPMMQAQNTFQLPNAGFEEWDGTGLSDEPTHWNSFASSDGSWAALASSPHHYHRYGSHPGGAGSSYLTIYTQSIIGIKANGNMTTGRIHAGSMSASSSDNYNYTERSNADHSLPFTATPDSMYVWVSFFAYHTVSEAQVEAILHGDNDFRAPNDVSDPSKYKGRAVIHTTRTTEYPDQMGWTLLKAAFNYNGSSTGNYMLVNMTTNNTPGAGEGDDSLSIDDIVFIYSAWLNGINVDGTLVADFDKGHFDYNVRLADTSRLGTAAVEAITEVSDATVNMTRERLNDTTAKVTITVTAEDSVTVRVYSVMLTAPTEPAPVGIAETEDVTTFKVYPNPAQTILNIVAEGEVTITDMRGSVLTTHQCHGTTQIDISNLPQGAYIIRTTSGSQRFIKKN